MPSTNNWWLWLGVIALPSWAYARYRRTFASQHTHSDHGAHRDDLKKETVRAIGPEHVTDAMLQGALRVLFKTRNSSFWAEEGFREDFTFMTPQAARALVAARVRLVGIDYLSVETFKSADHETHRVLLANDVVILEGLDLRGIAPGVYELLCLPLKLADGAGDGAPARAVLRDVRARVRDDAQPAINAMP